MAQDPRFTIAPENVVFYREHGWWISPPILDETVIEELKFGVERYLAGERDWALPVDLGEGGGADVVRQIDYLSLQIREFRDLMLSAPIAAMAAALAETPAVRLFHDQLVTKPPFDRTRRAVVGWHTDKAYWSSCSSISMITAWIPLDEVPRDKGPLAVWDGSHLWPDVESLHCFHSQDLRSIEDEFRRRGFDPKIVMLPMLRGQVSFHHCRLVHGGFSNQTDAPRDGYAIHLQDADNRYAPTTPHSRRGHANDLICRRTAEGHPDYTDPEIFPQLWP